MIKGNWHYIGDVIVGVDCDCNCPPIHPRANDGCLMPEPPHEGHTLIEPVDQFNLPEGWEPDEWIAACKLTAAAPRMLALLIECDEYLSGNKLNSICSTSILHGKMKEIIAQAETGNSRPGSYGL